MINKIRKAKNILLLILFNLFISYYSALPGTNSGDPKDTPGKDPKDIKDKISVENNFIISGDDPEEIFMDLTYEKLFNKTISAYLVNDKIYLPIVDLLKELRINYSSKSAGKFIEGDFTPVSKNYIINFDGFYSKIGEKYIDFNKNDFLFINGVYYTLPSIFESLFNSNLDFDFNNLSINVRSMYKLPVLVFHERQLGRTDLSKNKSEVKAPLLFNRERNYLNAGFIDYSISISGHKNTKPIFSYDITLGNEFIGGDLNTSIKGNISNENLKSFDPNFIWRYCFKKNWLINQIHVGELSYNGLFHGPVNGVEFTNTPVEPRSTFDKYTISEKTIPNSDVELYINNQLYDYKKADALGNVFFEIPLTFGSNLIYMKIFSPTGEVLFNNKKINVPPGFLPAGSIDYNFAYGEIKGTGDKLLSANLSLGITNWLTNKTGVEKISNDESAESIYFNTTSARLFSQYLLNFTIAPDLYRRTTLNTSFSSQLYFELAHTKYKENSFYNKSIMNEEYSAKGILPFNFGSSQFVTQLQVKDVKYLNGSKIFRIDAEQSFNFHNFRSSINFNHVKDHSGFDKRITNRSTMGLYYLIPELLFLRSNLIDLKCDYNFTDKRFENLHAIFTTSVTDKFRVQVGYQTSFQPESDVVNAQFILELPYTRNYISVNRNSVSALVQGSIGMDVNYDKWLFYNRHQVGSSAVSFRMFHDKNNNGKYDKGEDIIDDIKLDLKQIATFDRSSNQVLRVTELLPNQEYTIEINENSLKNPLLLPKHRRFSFIPSANVYKKIDIPFYMTEEISGSVRIKKGEFEMNVGGIQVMIKDLVTNELTTLSTYFDGGLYALGFPPGKYVAYVKPEHLRNIKGKSLPEHIKFTISNDDDREAPEDINFIIELPE